MINIGPVVSRLLLDLLWAQGPNVCEFDVIINDTVTLYGVVYLMCSFIREKTTFIFYKAFLFCWDGKAMEAICSRVVGKFRLCFMYWFSLSEVMRYFCICCRIMYSHYWRDTVSHLLAMTWEMDYIITHTFLVELLEWLKLFIQEYMNIQTVITSHNHSYTIYMKIYTVHKKIHFRILRFAIFANGKFTKFIQIMLIIKSVN